MTKIYSARWVLPVSAPAIDDGAVAVDGERIVGVGPLREVAARYPGAARDDFGEAAILPGLVNCHSHLELTVMRGFLEREEGNFFAWLRKLTTARREKMTGDALYISATLGAVEAARFGVTCVGDACSEGEASMAALRDVGLRGTVFQEVFGPDPSRVREHFDEFHAHVERLRREQTPLVRVGVSPHAPYSVSGPLIELVTGYAVENSLPLMMHAAESEAEDMLVRGGRGIFADDLARRNITWRVPGVSVVQYLASLGVLRARALLAHCVKVDQQDIATLRQHGASVAHCPKSNAKFGHGRAPFAAFIEGGLKVGIGSDSVASNNTCDLLEEARFAVLLSRAGGDRLDGERMLGADELLRAATFGSAQALGIEDRTGTLMEGLQADLIAVALDGTHQRPVHDAATALVFSSSGRDVHLTVVAGREVYRDGRVTTVDEQRLRARAGEIARRLEE